MAILDTELLVERRLAQGLSQAALAKELGLPSTQTVVGLERGTNHERLTLHQLARLAIVLGVHPAELFAKPTSGAKPTADSLKVEEALANLKKKIHPEDLARGFGWTLKRTNQAFRDLRGQRASAGERVHYSGGRWGFTPGRAAVTSDQLARLERACTTRDHLSVSQARVLLAVARDRVDGRWMADASEDQRIAIAKLLRLRWIEEERGGFRLESAVRANLSPPTRGTRKGRRPNH